MSEQTIAFQVALPVSHDEAVEQVTAALKTEGFGVLTSIDVKDTLKKKIDQEFRPYTIMGACNPPLAHRALSSDALVGLFLPCNVTVEETAEGALISIMNPELMVQMPVLQENSELVSTAAEVRVKLERVAQVLEAGEKVN